MSLLRCLMPFVLGTALVGQPAAPVVRLKEAKAAPGGLLLLVAEGGAGQNLRAAFQGKQFAFFPHPADPTHRLAAFVPIPFDAVPGSHSVEIQVGSNPPVVTLPFGVTKVSRGTIAVTVAPHIATPSEADQARVKREREEILKIYAEAAPDRIWTAAFRDPVKSKVTCGFGVQRSFNGKVLSVHKGLDLRAATGTPVYATAAGTVRLAKDLFYGGNLVLIDHGCGLFSSYAHLSRIGVKVGQSVQPGDLLGHSGATGRVSAPHLHWGTSLAGTEVNPLEFKRLTAFLMTGVEGDRNAGAARPARKKHSKRK